MQNNSRSAVRTVLFSGLLAGTLDITAAIVFLGKMKAEAVLRYVASGAFGQRAFTGDWTMILFGLIFHYSIAMAIALAYFLAYPKIKLLRLNTLLSAFMIGVVAWCVTNLIIVPISAIGYRTFDFDNVIKNAAILDRKSTR